MIGTPQWMTVRQAAERLGCVPRTVMNVWRRGDLIVEEFRGKLPRYWVERASVEDLRRELIKFYPCGTIPAAGDCQKCRFSKTCNVRINPNPAGGNGRNHDRGR